jgi:hypothetical protein
MRWIGRLFLGRHDAAGDLTTDSHVHSWPDGLPHRSERRITVNTWGDDQRLLASAFTLDSVNPINPGCHSTKVIPWAMTCWPLAAKLW